MTHAYRTTGLALTLAVGHAAFAQTPPTPSTIDDSTAHRLSLAMLQDETGADVSGDPWRVHFNSWIWAMGVNGDIGTRGVTKSVDASFKDVLDASDSLVGLSGRLEIGKGKWGGFIDGTYAKIGVEDITINRPDIDVNADVDFNIDLGNGPFNPNPNPNPNPQLNLGLLPAEVDFTLELAIVDFGVMYRLGDWQIGENSPDNHKRLTLDAYGGARYTMVEIEIDPANAPSQDRDRDWVDPIVGLKTDIPIADHWHIGAWGDIGGFGVGSDLTWSLTGVLVYDFELFDHTVKLYGGYRAIGIDYSDGSGSDEVVLDVTLHGPIVGFSFLF